MRKTKKENERKEAWMRLVVGIVSGIILYVWSYLIILFFIINFLYAIFTGKKLRGLAEMSEMFNTQAYVFWRYMTFVNNRRPFPFVDLEPELSKVE